MSARLIVSLSGIRDKHLESCEELAGDLDRRGVPLSLLVSPRRGEKYRLADDAETQEWIRVRHGSGDALVLSGYDEAATKRRRAEFKTISRSEAFVRLTAAKRLMADIGLDSTMFAPPRWVASPGAMEALPAAGFSMCADVSGIHELATGGFERGRMLSLGEGFVADALWCRAMVAAAGRIAGVGGLVRLNIAAKHLQRPNPRAALFEAIDTAISGHGARATRYQPHREDESASREAKRDEDARTPASTTATPASASASTASAKAAPKSA